MSNTGRPQVLVLGMIVILLISTGCGTLDGKWDGDFDCGNAGTYEIEVDLDKVRNNLYAGDGEITAFCINDGDYCWDAEFYFEIEVVTTNSTSRIREIEMELDDCELYVEAAGESFDSDCEDVDDAEWDGKDEIVGETEFFGADCDFELNR